MSKPTTAVGYDAGLAAEARRLCLYVATILGDLSDEVVVVGGLVPYLIIDQRTAQIPHVGTRDLDLGLALALLDEERYRDIGARLRDRGSKPASTLTLAPASSTTTPCMKHNCGCVAGILATAPPTRAGAAPRVVMVVTGSTGDGNRECGTPAASAHRAIVQAGCQGDASPRVTDRQVTGLVSQVGR